MATITAKTVTKYAIVSITSGTKTIVVSGDVTSVFTSGGRIRVTGTSTTTSLKKLTVSGNPVYSAPNTSIVVSESVVTSGAVGYANLPLVAEETSSWVGGVVPGTGDAVTIPIDSDVVWSSNQQASMTILGVATMGSSSLGAQYGSVEVKSGGVFTFEAGDNRGTIRVESSGLLKYYATSDNYGTTTVDTGGTCEFISAGNPGTINVQGVVTFTGSSMNNGLCSIKDGGTVSFTGENWGEIVVRDGGTLSVSATTINHSLIYVEEGGVANIPSGYTGEETGAYIVRSRGTIVFTDTPNLFFFRHFPNAVLTGAYTATHEVIDTESYSSESTVVIASSFPDVADVLHDIDRGDATLGTLPENSIPHATLGLGL